MSGNPGQQEQRYISFSYRKSFIDQTGSWCRYLCAVMIERDYVPCINTQRRTMISIPPSWHHAWSITHVSLLRHSYITWSVVQGSCGSLALFFYNLYWRRILRPRSFLEILCFLLQSKFKTKRLKARIGENIWLRCRYEHSSLADTRMHSRVITLRHAF